MKKLSINIPTYNRAEFLVKNLSIIADQLNQDRLVDQIEINISDNASTDNTESVVKDFASQNPNLDLTYHRNEKNLGPDLNFIAAMQMAHGEYSILFGDDDYFEPHALLAYFGIIEANKDVTLFFSNRININAQGKGLGRLKCMREDVSTQLFDFSKVNDARSFFALTSDHSGILTFISSVIYKTAVMDEVGQYNEKCIGSCYSFLYYWWSALARGGKLMYIDDYYVKATIAGVTNNNYGKGLKRLLVDTEGLSTIAKVVFCDKQSGYLNDFLSAVRRPIGLNRILPACFSSSNDQKMRFWKSMEDCKWSSGDIRALRNLFSLKNSIKFLLKHSLPSYCTNKLGI